MRDYCILNDDNIVENIIVCESDDIAAQFNAIPSYNSAKIGDTYNPPVIEEPPPEPTDTEILNKLLGVI